MLKSQKDRTGVITSLEKTVSTEMSEVKREISDIASSMTVVQHAVPEIQGNTSELVLKMEQHEQKINGLVEILPFISCSNRFQTLAIRSLQQNVILDQMPLRSLCDRQQQLQTEMQCEIRSTGRRSRTISRLYRQQASCAFRMYLLPTPIYSP